MSIVLPSFSLDESYLVSPRKALLAPWAIREAINQCLNRILPPPPQNPALVLRPDIFLTTAPLSNPQHSVFLMMLLSLRPIVLQHSIQNPIDPG